MQREESAGTADVVELTEEPTPSISLEELVSDVEVGAAREAAPLAEARPAVSAAPTAAPAVAPGLRTARVVRLEGRRAAVAMRGHAGEIAAALAPDVDRELIEEAVANKDAVLVEVEPDGQVLVVGMVQTRKPRELHLKAEKVVIEGTSEVLLRSGRAAMRLREDGDVELVGSRISAASRGLFRIVGRILRLN